MPKAKPPRLSLLDERLRAWLVYTPRHRRSISVTLAAQDSEGEFIAWAHYEHGILGPHNGRTPAQAILRVLDAATEKKGGK